MSIDEERATRIVQSSIRKLDIGYQVELPWKEGEPQFRNNRAMAENRLSSLFRRFGRDRDFEKSYRRAVSKYKEEGYVSKILDEADAVRTDQHFLPHHGVSKKTGPATDPADARKLRIVFDSAA